MEWGKGKENRDRSKGGRKRVGQRAGERGYGGRKGLGKGQVNGVGVGKVEKVMDGEKGKG